MNRIGIDCTNLNNEQSVALINHWLKNLKIEHIEKITFSEDFKDLSALEFFKQKCDDLDFKSTWYFTQFLSIPDTDTIMGAKVFDDHGVLTIITAYRTKRATLEELKSAVEDIKHKKTS